MEHINLARYREHYSEQRERVDAGIDAISDFTSTEYPDICVRDPSGKYQHHNASCPMNLSDHEYPLCPFQRWDSCNDRIRWLDTAKFLSCYFRTPAAARSQQILQSFNEHRFVHKYECVAPYPNVELSPGE